MLVKNEKYWVEVSCSSDRIILHRQLSVYAKNFTTGGNGGMHSETEMRKHRCCFTGHRPEKLHRNEQEIVADLEKEIRRAINDGFVTYITGMARGVDIWAGEIVLLLKAEGYPIRLICACPYPGFEASWSKTWQNRCRTLLKNADLVRYISSQYSSGCFQVRNEWLVNHSSRVIAVFTGQESGTMNTINYAICQHVPVVRIKG